MPTTVKILIRGLAVIFEEGDHWRVIFLCDAKHKLDFSHFRDYGRPSRPVSLGRKGREITFNIDPPRPSGSATMGNGYEKIFNMSALYAHRDGVILRKPENMTKLDRVDMTIPFAEVFMEKDSGEEYEIKVNGTTTRPTPIGTVAEIVGAEILLNEGERLIITGRDASTPGGPAFPSLPPFPYVDESTVYTLDFDNDCGTDCDDTDDFGLYYDVMFDSRDRNFEVRAGRKGTVDRRINLVVPDGNCDPVKVEPPPPIEP